MSRRLMVPKATHIIVSRVSTDVVLTSCPICDSNLVHFRVARIVTQPASLLLDSVDDGFLTLEEYDPEKEQEVDVEWSDIMCKSQDQHSELEITDYLYKFISVQAIATRK